MSGPTPTGWPACAFGGIFRAQPTIERTVAKKFLLKDHLFSPAKVQRLADEIAGVHRRFDKAAFVRDALTEFPRLELKARISWLAQLLARDLPPDYAAAVAVIRDALPPPCDPALTDDDFGDFIYAPYGEFVATRGCTREHLTLSLNALHDITQRFSAEDAIRSFLNAFPAETMRALRRWTRDQNYHVRRLCSEGTRPRLPWSRKIGLAVETPIPLLDTLFADPTRYVTRSVANHLNDIARTHPNLVLETLERWRGTKRQRPDEMEFITSHALRTLIKAGNPHALKMVGVSASAPVRIARVVIPRSVKMNAALAFSFVLAAPRRCEVIVDYEIIFAGRDGKPSGKKVFKLKRTSLAPGTPVAIAKRHILRAGMTTRTLHRGAHRLAIHVNGRRAAEARFRLV